MRSPIYALGTEGTEVTSKPATPLGALSSRFPGLQLNAASGVQLLTLGPDWHAPAMPLVTAEQQQRLQRKTAHRPPYGRD